MSRNTQYQFVPTNPEDVETELIALYEAIFGTTVQPASPERLFIQYVAAAIIQERVINNYTGNQNIPSRAEGENLDALAELTYSKKRPEAKAATCTMRFSLSEAQKSAVLIPAGTRITDASKTLVWETREDNYVPIGETHIDVENVTCQTTGTAGNGYTPGQINKLVDVYDFYTSCENITTSAGGSDAPDDDEYYELMRSSMDAYSTAGATGSYIYWAKQESTEIKDVAAVSPTPGVVKIYVLMEDGKRVVWTCVLNGFAWVWCSYILAALDKPQIAEELSKVALAEIIVPVAVYAFKSVVENLSKNNHWPDKRPADTAPEPDQDEPDGGGAAG